MKKKITHYTSVHIQSNTIQATLSGHSNIKFCIIAHYPTYKEIGTFFVPTTSVNKYGWVDAEIVKSRARHDLHITYAHSTIGQFNL